MNQSCDNFSISIIVKVFFLRVIHLGEKLNTVQNSTKYVPFNLVILLLTFINRYYHFKIQKDKIQILKHLS